MESVFCLMISSGNTLLESKMSIEYQNYDNFKFIIKKHTPKLRGKNEIETKYLNCSENRNSAREIALNSNYNNFLFLDDDIIYPNNTISSLITKNKDIIAGWYPTIDQKKWVAGNFLPNNRFENFKNPENGVKKVDFCGIGCVLIKRPVLEKIKFEAGIQNFVYNEFEEKIYIGECGMFGIRAKEQNFEIFMDSEVICDHIKRGTI